MNKAAAIRKAKQIIAQRRDVFACGVLITNAAGDVIHVINEAAKLMLRIQLGGEPETNADSITKTTTILSAADA